MTQTKQDKTGILKPSYGTNYNSHFPNGDKPVGNVYYHGTPSTITGSFGTKSYTRSFLGGANGVLENTTIGATPANGNNWFYDQTSGYPIVIGTDPVRGKVWYSTEDISHFDAAIRYQFSTGVPENTRIYNCHWGRIRAKLNGVDFPYWMQVKHFRYNYINDINDNTVCDYKWHQQTNNSSILLWDNNTGVSGSLYPSQKAPVNDTWFFMEQFINTGTSGGTDAQIISRLFYNGHTYVAANKLDAKLYGDSNRYNWYIEQYYEGNFNLRTQSGNITITNVLNTHTYSINNGIGTTASFISDGSATSAEILTGLASDCNIKFPTFNFVVNGSQIDFAMITPDLTTNIYFASTDSANLHIQNDTTTGPYPDLREIYRDDNMIQVGNNTTDGWQRLELRDQVDEANCTIREVQPVTNWAGNIDFTYNLGGLSAGLHTLYLCVIDGIDSNGKDIVVSSSTRTVFV